MINHVQNIGLSQITQLSRIGYSRHCMPSPKPTLQTGLILN